MNKINNFKKTGFIQSFMEKVRAFYNILRKKYPKLPKFEDIDNEFEIKTIDPSLGVKELRRRVFEKLDMYDEFLESYIEPEGFSCMVESRGFSEKDMQVLFELYRKLTVLMKEALKLTLDSNEKKEIDYICKVYTEWLKMKPNLVKMVDCAIKGWFTDFEEVQQGYFG